MRQTPTEELFVRVRTALDALEKREQEEDPGAPPSVELKQARDAIVRIEARLELAISRQGGIERS